MNYVKEKRNNILTRYPKLYSGRVLPASENLMCFGFECMDGWLDLIDDLSIELEFLNEMIYPKYKCYIRACQVKEKFGSLRFYYDIVTDTPLTYRFLSIPFYAMIKFINKHFKFNMKYVKLNDKKYAYLPHKNKFIWKINLALCKIANWLNFEWIYLSRHEDDLDRANHYLCQKADALIAEAENRSERTCEKCGKTYGKMCTTTGWITHLCETCASKGESLYTYDDDDKHIVWKSGKSLEKTINDLRKERNT